MVLAREKEKGKREKEGWKTVAQKQEHRVPAIRIIASRDRGIRDLAGMQPAITGRRGVEGSSNR